MERRFPAYRLLKTKRFGLCREETTVAERGNIIRAVMLHGGFSEQEGRSYRLKIKISALVAAATMTLVLTGCGDAGAKTYDISPIFPLSSGKCAKYDGDQQGSGINATCMVSKTECEKAAADWRKAMESGGVGDAVEFSCD